MKKKSRIKDNKSCVFNLIVSRNLGILFFCFYIPFMYSFYVNAWEIPDYYLYNKFGKIGKPTFDGFGSIFILLSKYNLLFPFFFKFSSLLFVSTGMLIFLISFPKYLRNSFQFLYFFGVISLGCFWYFYGKVYYEFPFIVLLFSVSFFLSIFLVLMLNYKAVLRKLHN